MTTTSIPSTNPTEVRYLLKHGDYHTIERAVKLMTQPMSDSTYVVVESLVTKVEALYKAVNDLTTVAIKLNDRCNIHNEIGREMLEWVAGIEDKIDAHLVEAAAFKAEREAAATATAYKIPPGGPFDDFEAERSGFTGKDYNYYAKHGFTGDDS